MHASHGTAIFFTQLLLLVLVGRLLGELMQRLRQPAVMGQLLAGVLLGPSIFGALLPAWQHAIFPDSDTQKKMLDAVSELGVLLLLLSTGLETDLGLVRRMKRMAIFASAGGMVRTTWSRSGAGPSLRHPPISTAATILPRARRRARSTIPIV